MSPTQATKSYENSISVSFGKCNDIRWKKKKLGVVGATPSRHPNMRLHIGVKMFKKVSKNDTPIKSGLAIPETSLDKDRFLLSSHGST